MFGINVVGDLALVHFDIMDYGFDSGGILIYGGLKRG